MAICNSLRGERNAGSQERNSRFFLEPGPSVGAGGGRWRLPFQRNSPRTFKKRHPQRFQTGEGSAKQKNVIKVRRAAGGSPGSPGPLSADGLLLGPAAIHSCRCVNTRSALFAVRATEALAGAGLWAKEMFIRLSEGGKRGTPGGGSSSSQGIWRLNLSF